MSNLELFVTPTEFKFVSESEPGSFKGYGAVFNNLDSHKDVILPGAFSESLAQHEAKGTLPGLYVEHSAFTGGDPLPVGVWTKMAQDNHGLHVEGKLSALDTDHGRRIRGLMHDGALKGLSVAFQVPAGGALMGRKQGEPRRTLTNLKLHAVDIVRDPSNSSARIQELKSAFRTHLKAEPLDGEDAIEPDCDRALEAIVSALMSVDMTAKNAAAFVTKLQDAHQALTGVRLPDGSTGYLKAGITIRETEKILREECGLSRARASDIAARRFGSLPRDEGRKQAPAVSKQEVITQLNATLADFSLS